MAWSIHHVNLEARNVAQTARFYTEILGMTLGTWAFPETRGYLPGDPDKLALLGDGREGHTGLHLIAPDPEFATKNNMAHNPSIGGHVALQVDDLDGVIARLTAAGVPHSVTGEFAIPGLRHVYVEDPEGNLLEINGRLRPAPAPVRHIVLCQIEPTISQTEIDALWAKLEALRSAVPGMGPVRAGRNTSPEGAARGYTHAITIDFETSAARDAYLSHPDHIAAGAELVAMCAGGADGICVLDI